MLLHRPALRYKEENVKYTVHPPYEQASTAGEEDEEGHGTCGRLHPTELLGCDAPHAHGGVGVAPRDQAGVVREVHRRQTLQSRTRGTLIK